MTNFEKDDPHDITDYLIAEYGQDGALNIARDGTFAAQQTNDNYSLSVWREIKRILKERNPSTP